jgi:4-hydroxybenzoate polyprenyltransferase
MSTSANTTWETMAALCELARPKHWLKNVFVLMPVPFALADGAVLDPALFALGIAGFCLGNSAVYAFNDAFDVELDRRHPTKRERPVASNRVSVNQAFVLSAALMGTGLLLTGLTGRIEAVGILATYAALNAIYSVWGKHVPLLDVFLLSTGFVLRVLLGCALLAAAASSWLLLCSSGLALFLALAKRRADVATGSSGDHRPSLSGYNLSYLDQAIGITSAMTLMAYALYCMEAAVMIPGREFATLPFVVFGVFDYLRICHVKGSGDSPVDLLLSSPAILLCGVGWIIAALWSVGPI